MDITYLRFLYYTNSPMMWGLPYIFDSVCYMYVCICAEMRALGMLSKLLYHWAIYPAPSLMPLILMPTNFLSQAGSWLNYYLRMYVCIRNPVWCSQTWSWCGWIYLGLSSCQVCFLITGFIRSACFICCPHHPGEWCEEGTVPIHCSRTWHTPRPDQ